MQPNQPVYTLSVADIQTVDTKELGRTLSEEEINKVAEKLGDNIDWYNAILNTINTEI